MNEQFNKGILLTSLGSFWWGFIGVLYFEFVSFIGHVELVVHRCIWTAVMLIITTSIFSKWNFFYNIIKDKKKLLALFLSGFLIFINWSIWIYAVATEKIIDASFGYFIMPIISVLLGYIFFKENLNKKDFDTAKEILLDAIKHRKIYKRGFIKNIDTNGGSKKHFIKALRQNDLKVKDIYVIFFYGIYSNAKNNMSKITGYLNVADS